MTTRRFPKLVPLLCAAALSFGALACGDDDDDDVVNPDAAAVPDADTTDAVPTPDAVQYDAMPVSTRSGSISVVDTTLINSADPGTWWRGAVVDVNMVVDPPVVAAAYDDLVPPGIGCSATVYDIAGGDVLPIQQDEGAITIADTTSPLGPCAIPAGGDEYVCIFGANAIAAGDSVCAAADTCNTTNFGGMLPATTAAITIASGAFDNTTKSEVGMYVQLIGGGLSPQNASPVPVVDVLSPTTLLVGNPAAVTEAASAAGQYLVVSGAGPSPAKRAFLDDAAVIKVSKAAGAETDAFTDSEVLPGGKGFVPTTATIGAMTTFPIDATAAVPFSCNGAGGNCGTAQGTILVMSATDGDTSTDPTGAAMPLGDSWVSVSCRQFGDTVDLPLDIVNLIEAIGPTRIRVSMFRANLGLEGNADGTNQIGIVSGFGYVTFSNY